MEWGNEQYQPHSQLLLELANLENTTFKVKTAMATFLATLVKIWATFYVPKSDYTGWWSKQIALSVADNFLPEAFFF